MRRHVDDLVTCYLAALSGIADGLRARRVVAVELGYYVTDVVLVVYVGSLWYFLLRAV